MEIKGKEEKTLFFHTPQASEVKNLYRYTIAGIVMENTLYIGISRCSKKDTFKRSTGRKIAEVRMRSGIKDPGAPGLKRKFCAVPFEIMIGHKGFAKAFVDQAILTVKTVDTKWAKVDFDALRRRRLESKSVRKPAQLTVVE